ncbi:MAG: zinc ribbon domain-containing protein [Deltaproteobacteria bacterium]|nr:MAG: zinc ribbon domain-containing protein [Deltaproteobacteria bacterium]
MPIFEYRCNQCEQRFEDLVLSSDKIIQCPRCRSEDIIKELSSFAFSSNGKFRSSFQKGLGCLSCNAKNCAECK